MRIEPTVGRVVHYHPSADHPDASQTLTALICKVNPDGTINLAIFDSCGHQFSRQRVQIVQQDEAVIGFENHTGFCSWMPFQLGQAAKTDALQQHIDVMAQAGQANTGWDRTDNGVGKDQVDERGVPILSIPNTEGASIPVLGNSMAMTGDVAMFAKASAILDAQSVPDDLTLSSAQQAQADEATRLGGE